MKDLDLFWKLEALSDRQLLDRVGAILGSSRRLMAELVAHLGEVEERRLHLTAACSSMFAYCLKLGMTEDEAYRRIEVARLARRYPAIFPLLAAGQLTISVVALLKHHLSHDNHQELLAAVTGKSVVQTRELIAGWFPRPDVPTSVRKLPERRTVTQPSPSRSMSEQPRAKGTEPCADGTESCADAAEPRADGVAPRGAETEPRMAGTDSRTSGIEPHTAATQQSHSERAAPRRASSCIEPLSAQRYKVQFTASAELTRKLELARDSMRHCHPGGELGPVVERALDLLIERLMQRRFGKNKNKKTTPKRPRERASIEQRGDVMGDRFAIQHAARSGTAEPAPATDTPASAEPDPAKRDTPATADLAAHEPDMPATADLATHEPETRAAPTLRAPTLADPAAHDLGMHDGAADLDSSTTLSAANVEGEPRPDGDVRADVERPSPPSYIPRLTRRTVIERDGLGCSWVDEQGARCGSRAWLEYDHRHPRAKGGGSEPGNVRLLCRQHNRFAAEQEYGRRHVEEHIAERRRGPAPPAPHAI